MPLTTPYAGTPYRSAYEPRVYDGSQATANMADLIRSRGAALARGEQQAGDASRAMWLGVGGAISGTMNQLADYALKAPERKLQQARIDDELHQRRKAQQFEGLERMASEGGLDELGRANLYDQEGYHEQANKSRDYAHQLTRQKLEDDDANLSLAHKKLGQASQMLSGIFEVTGEDQGAVNAQRAAQYATLAPKVREIIGPELGQHLPETYDENAVKSAIAWGQTAQERLALQREASAALRDGLAVKSDDRKAQDEMNRAFANAMAGAGSPEEWEKFKDYARKLPVRPPDALFDYWNDYSPENIARAKGIITKSLDPNKLNIEDEIVRRYLNENPNATSKDLENLLGSITQRKRVSGGTGSGGGRPMTPATRATIERWKTNEFKKIEDNIRKGDVYTSDQEIDDAKEQVQASYLSQLGMDNGPSLADLASSRGQTISGRPIGAPPASVGAPAATGATSSSVAQTQTQAPPSRPLVPQGDAVLMESPHGERQYVRKEDVSKAEKNGARVVGQSAPQPSAPAPPPPQQQAWTPNVPLPGGPNAPAISVTTTERPMDSQPSPVVRMLSDLINRSDWKGVQEMRDWAAGHSKDPAASEIRMALSRMKRDFSKR